jgi:diaminopimelate decarboxylase
MATFELEILLAEPDGPRSPLTDIGVLRALDTPCYLYDPDCVREDYAELSRLLGTALIVSIKANSDPDLLAACVSDFTDGIELASRRELDIVRQHPVPKFLTTPALTPELMRAGLAAQATLVLDNLQQVELAIAESRTRKLTSLILRLNSGELLPEASRRSPGDRFGMCTADVIEAGKRLRAAGIPLRGMHVFAGSQTFSRAAVPLVAGLVRLLPDLEHSLGQRIGFLNLGGGIPAEWRSQKLDFRSYREALAPLQAGRVLAHEAGRAIFARCGAFVTRVLSRKRLNAHHVVACDGGMVHAFQLAQTELPIKLLRAPALISADATERPAADGPVLFVGNTCSNVDRIGCVEAGAPLPEPGDYCIFAATGAYFATYTLAGFLGIPPARVYVLPGRFGSSHGSAQVFLAAQSALETQ